MDSFIDGKREGVIFAFYDNNKKQILLEIRDEEKNDIFFTNGSIEEKDKHALFEKDYKKIALFKEVNEEFSSKVKIDEKDLLYLDELYVKEINVIFYIYLILHWTGIFPKYTIEDNWNFAKLI